MKLTVPSANCAGEASPSTTKELASDAEQVARSAATPGTYRSAQGTDCRISSKSLSMIISSTWKGAWSPSTVFATIRNLVTNSLPPQMARSSLSQRASIPVSDALMLRALPASLDSPSAMAIATLISLAIPLASTVPWEPKDHRGPTTAWPALLQIVLPVTMMCAMTALRDSTSTGQCASRVQPTAERAWMPTTVYSASKGTINSTTITRTSFMWESNSASHAVHRASAVCSTMTDALPARLA